MPIERNHNACWVVQLVNGKPADLERETHFPSRELVVSELGKFASLLDAEPADLAVTRLEEPCWLAVSVCGYVYAEDDDGIEHFQDQAEARQHLESAEYRLGQDGSVRCPIILRYAPDCGCGEAEPELVRHVSDQPLPLEGPWGK